MRAESAADGDESGGDAVGGSPATDANAAGPDANGASSDADPLVEVGDLTASFGDVPVVSGVDLRLDRGELVGLVGPNGAGKTTVIRAIKGTLAPDSGTVRLDGARADDLSAREAGRRVASVPQETSLAFDFRVRHVVEMGRTPHLGRFDGHGADDDRAVREAMDAAGVARFADRSIREVSGGERQRVLLARALAQGTPALLLDEPTASLDANHAVRTLELVRNLVDDGRGALAAIHDLDAAARYCDRIVVLANGGVHAAGPPDEVLTAGALRTAFDAEAFVGRNPATGTPAVTAFDTVDAAGGGDAARDGDDQRRLHVVGTGREASRVVARLAAAGHDLSVGVVPEGDAAAETARDAGAALVAAPPFEPVGPEAREAATALAREADATVVVDGAGGDTDRIEGDRPDPNGTVLAAADRVVEGDAAADDGALLDAVRGLDDA
ncbi:MULTISPECIES: ATP-binding cassette domain-containing protein [unclassified Halorubrum]|uniref:ATP-binding cassette domain-containing protein n=1 Tax=unclassified Halorubrum TaxID=2642239 RepID=UPI000B996277|nr:MULTISPECIES: ATP-binding cassette domain-containing protein [unclassified Halorubrum]OYR48775.1 corrinoid ABC transporter AT-binding protein [Halorubrum sp. Eb13]OYR55890.1 corrinoid ABC transporter AT-binding protein [Halorubrum sp. Ea1]